MIQSNLHRLKKLTTQLEESENRESLLAFRLKAVLEAAGAGVWDWEIDRDILRWNTRMLELFDYDPKNIPQDEEGWFVVKYSNFIDRVIPEDRERVQKCIDDCLNDRKPYKVTYTVLGRNGARHMLIQASGDIHSLTTDPDRLVGVCLSLEGHSTSEQ